MATKKFNYARAARTAQRLIDKFGSKAKLVGFVDVPNTDQPNRPGTRTQFEQEFNMVFLNYKADDVDGTGIRQGDQKVLMSAMNVLIPAKLTGTIVRDGEAWSIVQIKILNPGGTRIIYTAQVRK